MASYVAAIHLSGGSGHEHITEVIFVEQSYKPGRTDVKTVISHLRAHPGTVKVSDGKTVVDVGVVDGPRPYIRTYADKKWTDNLLALPRY